MGGYGAWVLGLTHPDKYLGISGISSVVSLDHLAETAPVDMKSIFRPIYQTIFGTEYPDDKKFGLESLITPELIAKKDDLPLLLQYEGKQDFMHEDNQYFKNLMLQNGFNLHYHEWDGSHEWGFWDSAIHDTLKQFSQEGESDARS